MEIVNLPNEEWRTLPFNKHYAVSNYGRVKSYGFDYVGLKNVRCVAYPRILKHHLHKQGYVYVAIRENKKPKTYKVHRLVAMMFLDNPFNKRTVNHIDRNRSNNVLSNLEWATHSENNKHRFSFDGVVSNRKGVYNEGAVRPVHQIDIKTMEIINTFPSMCEANRQTGVYVSSICAVIKGIYKTANGYKWAYAKM
jgi:hypothetical protein